MAALVSILFCLDTVWKTNFGKHRSGLRLFQSSSVWIRSGRNSMGWKNGFQRSFNPLLSGYGLEATNVRIIVFNNQSFNPLLSGYGLEGWSETANIKQYSKFQSSYVWIRSGRKNGILYTTNTLEFQSSYVWIRSGSRFSITTCVFYLNWFQSSYVWIRSGRRRKKTGQLVWPRFNPLMSGYGLEVDLKDFQPSSVRFQSSYVWIRSGSHGA